MKKLLHPLAGLTALGVVGALCTAPLSADPPKGAPAAAIDQPAVKPATDAPMTPVKITETRVATKTAVDPKPLSDTVKKGIDYIVKQQQEDGGWNQGGGWRTAIGPNAGGRIEGKNVEDPSDVGNTCFALLALFRAGSTPTDGPHKANVVKGLKFILTRVE
ncbi:MAG TPA: prenyltransferase/squalene oxidase repeat-containing protein, partial [Gemmataceae bacterium]